MYKALTVRYESKIITKRMNGQGYTECMLAYLLKNEKEKQLKITVQCESNTQQTRAGKHSHCLLKIKSKKKEIS